MNAYYPKENVDECIADLKKIINHQDEIIKNDTAMMVMYQKVVERQKRLIEIQEELIKDLKGQKNNGGFKD